MNTPKCMLVLWLLLGLSLSCGRRGDTEGGAAIPPRDVNQVKESLTPGLMSLPGVVGVYVGETKEKVPCIVVMVVKHTKELERRVPRTVEGYPVVVEETGKIVPMDSTRRN